MIFKIRIIRKWIDDLFYSTFDNLTEDQRLMFKSILDSIDKTLKDTEQF